MHCAWAAPGVTTGPNNPAASGLFGLDGNTLRDTWWTTAWATGPGPMFCPGSNATARVGNMVSQEIAVKKHTIPHWLSAIKDMTWCSTKPPSELSYNGMSCSPQLSWTLAPGPSSRQNHDMASHRRPQNLIS